MSSCTVLGLPKHSIRQGDLEFRRCDRNLLQSGQLTGAELVFWDSVSTCYTIAYWMHNPDEDSFDFQWVGDRPLRNGNYAEFCDLVKQGFEWLTKNSCILKSLG